MRLDASIYINSGNILSVTLLTINFSCVEAWVGHNVFICTLKISASDVAAHNKTEKKFDINLFFSVIAVIFPLQEGH